MFFFQTLKYYSQVYYRGGEINSVDIDNEVIVSGSGDNKTQVWSLQTHRQLFEVEDESSVSCVKIVDRSIVSCGDKTVRIWNLTDGTLFHKLQLPGSCRNFDLNSEIIDEDEDTITVTCTMANGGCNISHAIR